MKPLLTLTAVLALTACATPQPRPRVDTAAARCLTLFEHTDAAVARESVGDAMTARIRGFPYLRADRLLASFRDEIGAPDAQKFWISRLAALDAEARALLCDRLSASGLTVRSLKRRWGSCSVHRQITLAAQLIELPLPLIDYVICHELCHLRHMDHSPSFHAALRRMLPDARSREKSIRIWSLEHPRS